MYIMQKSNKIMDKVKPVDKKILKLIQDKDLCVPRITKIAHHLNILRYKQE